MKQIINFLLVLIAMPSFGQDDDLVKQYPKSREKIQAARAAYITERLALTTDEAEKFWPVYREYVQKRKELRHQYRDAEKNDEDERALLDLNLKVKQQELDLEKDYSTKFLEVISAQKLMMLPQVESDFRKLLLRQIEQRHRRQLNKR